VDLTLDWLQNNDGHPCIEIPTGGGKTIVLAEFCRIVTSHGGKVLVLTHVKELIEQGFKTASVHLPNVGIGVYSAGLKRRELGYPVTFAGIQSMRNKAHLLGHIDVVIIDEAHLLNHKDEGMYRALISSLASTNPQLRVIGLTATPYRMGHGLITDGDALFSEIIRPTSIEELIYKGHLAKLRSKLTGMTYDVSGVKKSGGDFASGELERNVDTDQQNDAIVRETIAIAGERRHWLFFCSGVAHAIHMRDVFRAYGITCECVLGSTPDHERDDIIARYMRGEFICLTNNSVLTTGFDFPDIDLIGLCRPTMSRSLYFQMGGRGLRPKSHTDHCLVLDYAGVVAHHGPITADGDAGQKKSGSGEGEAPVKLCDQCNEIVAAGARVCPTCGYEFPPPEKKELTLHNDDIMRIESKKMEIESWSWCQHMSRNSGRMMLRVSYYGKDLVDPTIHEYLCLRHEGYARAKSERELQSLADKFRINLNPDDDLDALAGVLNSYYPPEGLVYKPDGKFFKIISKSWGPPPEYNNVFGDGDDDIPF
jgi:DNA repair protein RadD